MGFFAKLRRLLDMPDQLDEALGLMRTAVEEAVSEIKKLADQLAICAATPMVPEDSETLNEKARELRELAMKLHGAVYPPSSAVPLEPKVEE